MMHNCGDSGYHCERGEGCALIRLGLAALFVLVVLTPARGQAPQEHEQHHPAVPSATPPAPAQPPMPSSPAAPGPQSGGMDGMMGQKMGGMMGQGMGGMMGAPPPKALYPSLMALPDEVTPEERAGIEQLAHERMKAGTALLSSGLEKLSASTSAEDYAAMQQATAQMREGLAEFEAGIAARRVLAEGKPTRNLALDWFKREMNLASPIRPDEPRALLGVTAFHLFTMVLLIAFALAMVAMYFFKMRRAAALFGRLGPDTNPPPPGASPPFAGAPAPSAASATSPGGSSAVPVPGGDAANAG